MNRIHFDAGVCQEVADDQNQAGDTAYEFFPVIRMQAVYTGKYMAVFMKDRWDQGPPVHRRGGRIAHDEPDDAQNDKTSGRKGRSQQHEPFGEFGNGIETFHGEQCGCPVEHDDDDAGEYAVIGQFRVEHVGQRAGGKSQHAWIPDDHFDPQKPDDEETEPVTIGLFDPAINATVPAGTQFGCHKSDRNEEYDGRNQKEHDRTETIYGHGRQRTDTCHSGHHHERDGQP